MGEVTGLFVVMLLIAAGAFAPLGYFIYKYMGKNAEPFGNIEPHGDSPSMVNDFAEKVIAFFKKQTGGAVKKQVNQAGNDDTI